MSNVSQKDMDGGYAENIKIAARTSRISFFKDRTRMRYSFFLSA